jgi:tyrosine-protein kinase Etk/Wzc
MLRFATAERPKVIGITSPAPASGKSTISVNLAAAMAQQGERVLLIDADLRRPMQHQIFGGEDKGPGLTDVLVGDKAVKDVIRDMRDFKVKDSAAWAQRLWLLTAGSQTPNPAELLGSAAFDEFLKRARREFDAVVIDTAPVLAVTDATVAGTFMDGMLVVAGADETERPALKESIRQLRQAKVVLLGAVLNKVPESNQYYGYRRSKYYKYYRTTDGEKKRKRSGGSSRKRS